MEQWMLAVSREPAAKGSANDLEVPVPVQFTAIFPFPPFSLPHVVRTLSFIRDNNIKKYYSSQLKLSSCYYYSYSPFWQRANNCSFCVWVSGLAAILFRVIKMAAGRSVFVTVGTTKFEELVQAVLKPNFVEVSWLLSTEWCCLLLTFRY